MLKRFGVQTKMVALVTVMTTATAVVGFTGYYSMKQVVADYQKLADFNLPNVMSLGEMKAQVRLIRVNLRTLVVPGATESDLATAFDQIKDATEKYEKYNKIYQSVESAPGEDELYKPVAANWSEMQKITDQALTLQKSKLPGDQTKLIHLLLNDEAANASKMRTDIDKLIAFHRAAAAVNVSNAAKSYKNGCTSLMIFVLIGAVFSLLLGLGFSRSLIRILTTTTGLLSSSASNVASASEQVSSASDQLSASTAQQAASLQETSASVEQISAMIGRNTENAQRSRDVALGCQSTTELGKKSMAEMADAIQAISESNRETAEQVSQSNKEIAAIVQLIGEIEEKTRVINDIVFQTKLLSFNASVEAARAGEHGKGFAVVAEEVGSLAQMSGNAAKEITDLLQSSVSKVQTIVQHSQSQLDRLVSGAKERVDQGNEVAQRCLAVLNQISEQTTSVTQMSTEIASASTEQSAGVHEINKTVKQLDEVTQQNSASSHQAAAAAGSLSDQADQLKGLVGELLRFVHGA